MLFLYTQPPGKTADKEAQIERCMATMARGDISAMSELYELIKTDIYAFALSKFLNKADAEDITHDTFVQIYKNAPLYRSQGKPMAWIFTIELNLIRRQYQHSRRIVELNESTDIGDTADDFTQKIIENEFLRDIMRILNDDEREIISLHINSGMKHREIAKLLNKPLSTVLSKYNRAIKKMRAIVKEEGKNA